MGGFIATKVLQFSQPTGFLGLLTAVAGAMLLLFAYRLIKKPKE